MSLVHETPLRRTSPLPIYGTALLVFVYIVIRAVSVSFTVDESFTYLNYVSKPWEDATNVIYTNNHLLNTVLTRLSAAVFGSSELALRLPNVLAGGLFLFLGARLVLRLAPGIWSGWLFFLSLSLNGFLLDFFSLSRGYGLSLGLLMAAVYCQYKVFGQRHFFLYEMLALVCSALAAMANYTLINFFLFHAAFVLATGLIRVFARGLSPGNRLVALLAYLALGAGTVRFVQAFLAMMFRLNELKNFDFGGNSGFWNDTLRSLAVKSTFHATLVFPWLPLFVMIAAVVLFGLGAWAVLLRIRARDFTGKSLLAIFLFFALSACVAAIELQHAFFGISYSIDRTALYFLPLFALFLPAAGLPFAGKRPFVSPLLSGIYCLPFGAAFILWMNFESTLYWPHDRNMKEAFQQFAKLSGAGKASPGSITTAVSFDIFNSFNYYLCRNKIRSAPQIQFHEFGYRPYADYLVLLEDESKRLPQGPYRLIWAGFGKTILVRNSKLAYRKLAEIGQDNFEQVNGSERGPGYNSAASERIWKERDGSNLIRDTLRDTVNGLHRYRVSFRMKCETAYPNCMVVFNVNRKGAALLWKTYDLTQYADEPGKWIEVVVPVYNEIQLLPGDDRLFYVINKAPENIYIDDLLVEDYVPEE